MSPPLAFPGPSEVPGFERQPARSVLRGRVGDLLVINAFAAAMFGRLRSLPLTFVGAIVLGFATRMAFDRPTGLMPKSFEWGGNLRLAVPMILLFVVLLLLPQDNWRGEIRTGGRRDPFAQLFS